IVKVRILNPLPLVAMDFAIWISLGYSEGDFLSLHHRSSSAKRPGCAPCEKTFARPSLGFFFSACLPPFCGLRACGAECGDGFFVVLFGATRKEAVKSPLEIQGAFLFS
ncbi:MAG: hypothetical protein IJP03_02270, partial [Christensenellaceae bacterium]|nr:hypothetical protein [Christensenellaceae bacterium]